MTFSRIVSVSAAIIAAVAFQGCSGQGQGKSGHRKSQTTTTESRCTPDTASMGEEVTCSVADLDFNDGDTVALDNTGLPNPPTVTVQYDSDAETITFVVPSFSVMGGSGQATVTVAALSGDEAAVEISKLTVKRAFVRSSGGSEDSGDDITPTATSGKTGCVADTDCVSGYVCKDGSCVADTVTSAPAPVPTPVTSPTPTPAPAPKALSLEVKRVDGSSKLQTVKISWGVDEKVKQVYLAGNLFNRSASDTNCKPTWDKRYLVTDANGFEIDPNPSTPIHVTYEKYLEGKVCDNSNASIDDDCDLTWFPKPVTTSAPATAPSKYDYVVISKPALEAKADEMTAAIFEETNPYCRIDLPVSLGEVFTRSRALNGGVCLVVVMEDGKTKSLCKQVVAPKAVVSTSEGAMVRADKSVIVEFDYKYASEVPTVSGKGCFRTWATALSSEGGGHVAYTCDYSDRTPIIASVQGFGALNKDRRIFDFELGEPEISLKDMNRKCLTKKLMSDNPVDWEDCVGTFDIEATVGRALNIVERRSGKLAWKGWTTFGISAVDLHGKIARDARWIDVPTQGGAEKLKLMITDIRRDHASFYWWAFAKRAGGGKSGSSNDIFMPYSAEFRLTTPVDYDGNVIFPQCDGDWNWNDECDKWLETDCENAGDGYWSNQKDMAVFSFYVRHVDMMTLEVDCGSQTYAKEWLQASLKSEGHGTYLGHEVGVRVVEESGAYSCKITYKDFAGNSHVIQNSIGSGDLPHFGLSCEGQYHEPAAGGSSSWWY